MKQTKFAKALALSTGVLVFSVSASYMVLAWTAPSSTPPGNNASAPINTSTVAQGKLGNLGIGTASPGAKLDVADSGAIAGAQFLRIGDDAFLTDIDVANTLGIYGLQNSAISIIKLGSAGGTIAGYNGNIGIGTASPSEKLEVAGYVKGQTGICIANDCRTAWPSSGSSSLPSGTANGQTIYYNGSNWATSNQIFNNNSKVAIGGTETDSVRKLTVWGGAVIATGDFDVVHGAIASDGNMQTNNDLVAGRDAFVERNIWANGTIITKGNIQTDNDVVLGHDIRATRNITIGGVAYKPGGGSWLSSSDERLKTNIVPITNAVKKISQLQGVNFKWINPQEHGDDSSIQGGFIAQDIEKIFPEWVKKIDANGADKKLIGEKEQALGIYLPFEYNALVVESIKEQQQQIENQQKQIDLLKSEIKELQLICK